MTCRSDPAVFVERAISQHLEVLDMARARGFGIVEAVHHAHALDRFLFHAIYLCRLGKLCGLENGRRDVDDVMELRADSAGIFNTVRPCDHERVARATQVRCHLLTPLERRVHGPGPADGNVVRGLRATQVINMLE